MIKKVLVLTLPLILSGQALANKYDMQDTKSKAGHTFHVGVSKLTGDLSDAIADSKVLFDKHDDAIFSLGYDYTTKAGVIFGGYYMPELLSVVASLPVTAPVVGNAPVEIKSQVLGFYSGYQFDNNLRLTGGLSFTYTEGDRHFTEYTTSDSETNLGFMLGLDYLIADNFLVGARVTSHKVGENSGITTGINLGYKL
ncbi:MAG: outer membrane beta-barrel protein [Enterovibrio sp.]